MNIPLPAQITTPIKIGLIGCGGRLRSVADNLLRETGNLAEIIALHDPSEESLREAKILAPAARIHDSVQSLVSDPSVDWVMIGSSNCFHVDQAIAAFEAGKHVFCEKPLATSLADCLRLRDTVAKHPHLQFYFGLVLRSAPHYVRIQEIVASGVLGRIVSFEFNETLSISHGAYIHGNWRRLRSIAGTHMLEKCCHDLDLANWIVNSLPIRVASFGGLNVFTPENQQLEDLAGLDAEGRSHYQPWKTPAHANPFTAEKDIFDNQVVILEYASGARATLHTNAHSFIRERRFYICGTHGTLRADSETGQIQWQCIGKDQPVHTENSSVAGGHLGGDESMAKALAQTMLHGAPPAASLREGLHSACAAYAIDEAADTGTVVNLQPIWQQL